MCVPPCMWRPSAAHRRRCTKVAHAVARQSRAHPLPHHRAHKQGRVRCREAVASAARRTRVSGNMIDTHVPHPGALSISSLPPCSVISWLVRGRPRPDPSKRRLCELSTWRNGSKAIGDILRPHADASVAHADACHSTPTHMRRYRRCAQLRRTRACRRSVQTVGRNWQVDYPGAVEASPTEQERGAAGSGHGAPINRLRLKLPERNQRRVGFLASLN
jgi:hypothetical protein